MKKKIGLATATIIGLSLAATPAFATVTPDIADSLISAAATNRSGLDGGLGLGGVGGLLDGVLNLVRDLLGGLLGGGSGGLLG